MSISDRLDETTEQAARVIGSVMSRWDMDGRPDVAGGIDTLIARALAEAGLLATEPRIEAAGREWIAFPADQIREEWRAASTEGGYAEAKTRHHAEALVRELNGNAHDEGRPTTWSSQCRHVTDWEPADD